MLALAGVAGRIVAGTGCGVLLGVTFRVDSLIVAGYGCLFLPFREPWLLCVVLGITALIGGILGGYSVRTRSGR
jgi:hypothetical protein